MTTKEVAADVGASRGDLRNFLTVARDVPDVERA
jgi:hypothetical protein